MLNVPSEIQAVIKNDATLKNFRAHFPNGERADLTNENIVYESVSFTESVCSNDVFRFGLAEASVIEFETVGVENIIGMTIECSMEFKVPENLQQTYGQWYSIPYGTFIIDSCPRNHQNITHRKVTGYSFIKTSLTVPTFLQKRILPVPEVYVPLNSLIAYYTNDVSKFTETVSNGSNVTHLGQGGVSPLFTSNGVQIDLYLSSNASRASAKQYSIDSGHSSAWANDKGYILEYKETGSITNEEFGLEVVRQFESVTGLDVRYDRNGKKIFETNEEAIRFAYPLLFHPSECKSILPSNSNFRYLYRGHAVEIGKFNPIYYDSNFEADDYGGYVAWLKGIEGGGQIVIGVMRENGDTNYRIRISGYEAEARIKVYKQNGKEMGFAKFKSTLAVTNTFVAQGFPSDNYKNYYGTMYAYSNAFSNRDMMNGIAEMNGSFVHSERDGSISVESLDNSNPYQLSLSDVEDSAWWDEYDVNPVGTIRYTFTNPATGQTANGSYVFDESAKSVYDISGNSLLEALDFRVFKASTVAKMTNKYLWYVYTGNESGYTKNDFYYHNGSSWVSGGHYDNAESIVHFVLDRLFVPHINKVNFTPVEMDIRGLPFLEAGDAFTLALDDGTVLNSYILNHTFNGIQRLSESITSVSGEVIE